MKQNRWVRGATPLGSWSYTKVKIDSKLEAPELTW
jgi:hypothetical protein